MSAAPPSVPSATCSPATASSSWPAFSGSHGNRGDPDAGEDVAVFEAVHGSAPGSAGRNIANPLAVMRSAILMSRHLEMRDEAERIAAALRHVGVDLEVTTRDLGGRASTSELTEAVVRAIET